MITFDAFVARHGEGSVQLMLEDFERHNKLPDHVFGIIMTLEERWDRFMGFDVNQGSAEATRNAA